MMDWLLIIILAYLFFSFGSFCDKLVLSGATQRAPRPKSYTFYVGVFGLFIVLLIPFIKFGFPNNTGLAWIILDSFIRILGIYTMFVALERFDVSRVMATIGATQPMFIFILTWIFWGPQPIAATYVLAFVLLLIGSVIISINKNVEVTGNYLKITIFSSLMFSLDYIFSKFVYLNQPFPQGLVWINIFMFLFVLFFLVQKNSRKEIFAKQMILNKRTQIAFLCAQGFGGVANFLQSFAISLAPVAFLAIINSLRGIQYAFLFLATLFTSFFFPRILKEELLKKIVIQKTISIIIIAIGLALLIK